MSESGIAGFSWLDIILITVIGLSIITGVARGLVKTIISIVTWLAAAYLAYTYAAEFTQYLESYVSNAEVRVWITRIGIFVLVMIIGAIIGNIISQLVAVGGMKGFDRILGLILGAVLGVLIASILILVAGFTTFPETEMFKTSVLVPQLMEFVNYLREFLPSDIQQHIHFPADPIVSQESNNFLGDGKSAAVVRAQ